MMNHSIESNFYNVEENEGETDNYVTCPLLQLKYSRSRKPITSRLGQKGRSLKHINENRSLFENKTAEADLGGSFQIRTPENLVGGFEKLDLVHDTPFVRPAIKNQNDNDLETPSDTLTNIKNVRPNIELSTKRSLYSNKENLPEQIKELRTPESQKLNKSNISTPSLTIKEISNKSSESVKDETYYVSPETSKYNYDTSLYHSIRETTVIPETSHSSFSTNNSLTTKQLECQPLDDQSKHTALELSPAANRNNFVIRARSPIRHIPVGFIQDGEFKRPINSSSSVCVKCANENYISVKGINYSILNTLGHGGSSVVYEVNICLLGYLYYDFYIYF
uniref:Uncharacterized protein n=1 Tax=Schizaphis graminum TaxID=13262 RepID=A0A2S2NEY7_SCHGA